MNDRVSLLMAAAAEFVTPLAVVDEAIRERNLARMQRLATAHGLRLRPHAKTHKSVHVAQRQVAHGAVGVTVATLKEAEVYASGGVEDMVIAHPPVGEPKLRRLRALAEHVPHLAVAVDSIEVAATIPSSIEVLWEVDTGLHRLGTPAGEATAAAVRDLVKTIGAERFRGLLTHGGHAYRAASDSELFDASREEAGGLVESAALIRTSGIKVRELSIGSTPTTRYVEHATEITEMRPGTYVYGDANQVQLGSQALEDCALVVVATVISRPESGRAVVDAGSKALSADLRVPGVDGHGIVVDHPMLRLDRLSEEHGVLVAEGRIDLAVGDRVAIIPNHVCTAVNLHPALLVVGARGEARWETVDARGWQ